MACRGFRENGTLCDCRRIYNDSDYLSPSTSLQSLRTGLKCACGHDRVLHDDAVSAMHRPYRFVSMKNCMICGCVLSISNEARASHIVECRTWMMMTWCVNMLDDDDHSVYSRYLCTVCRSLAAMTGLYCTGDDDGGDRFPWSSTANLSNFLEYLLKNYVPKDNAVNEFMAYLSWAREYVVQGCVHLGAFPTKFHDKYNTALAFVYLMMGLPVCFVPCSNNQDVGFWLYNLINMLPSHMPSSSNCQSSPSSIPNDRDDGGGDGGGIPSQVLYHLAWKTSCMDVYSYANGSSEFAAYNALLHMYFVLCSRTLFHARTGYSVSSSADSEISIMSMNENIAGNSRQMLLPHVMHGDGGGGIDRHPHFYFLSLLFLDEIQALERRNDNDNDHCLCAIRDAGLSSRYGYSVIATSNRHGSHVLIRSGSCGTELGLGNVYLFFELYKKVDLYVNVMEAVARYKFFDNYRRYMRCVICNTGDADGPGYAPTDGPGYAPTDVPVTKGADYELFIRNLRFAASYYLMDVRDSGFSRKKSLTLVVDYMWKRLQTGGTFADGSPRSRLRQWISVMTSSMPLCNIKASIGLAYNHSQALPYGVRFVSLPCSMQLNGCLIKATGGFTVSYQRDKSRDTDVKTRGHPIHDGMTSPPSPPPVPYRIFENNLKCDDVPVLILTSFMRRGQLTRDMQTGALRSNRGTVRKISIEFLLFMFGSLIYERMSDVLTNGTFSNVGQNLNNRTKIVLEDLLTPIAIRASVYYQCVLNAHSDGTGVSCIQILGAKFSICNQSISLQSDSHSPSPPSSFVQLITCSFEDFLSGKYSVLDTTDTIVLCVGRESDSGGDVLVCRRVRCSDVHGATLWYPLLLLHSTTSVLCDDVRYMAIESMVTTMKRLFFNNSTSALDHAMTINWPLPSGYTVQPQPQPKCGLISNKERRCYDVSNEITVPSVVISFS